jgi:hypothetical protein
MIYRNYNAVILKNNNTIILRLILSDNNYLVYVLMYLVF